MLGGTSKARHGAVAVVIGGITALTGFGVIGGGDHPQRYDTWQVVIEPAGGDALRITETFDQDFGSNDRHGHERLIPNDYGAPTDVVASSPDAPDDLDVVDLGDETRIRIGDPDTTVSGQHRYTLAYTLPAAQLADGELAVDALAGDEFDTLAAEVVVRGFELADQHCFIGGSGSTDQCELRDEGEHYRADLGRLEPYTGITIDGTIVAVTAPAEVDPLPLPERRSENRLPLTAAVAVLGSAVAVPIYRRARRVGRNEVYAGGAADAAFGVLPGPSPDGSVGPPPPVTLVTDADLPGLATIEFAPPKGLQPWEAAVLLNERLDGTATEAWLSGLAGRDAVEIAEDGNKLVIGSGPKRGELAPTDAALLAGILAIDDPYVTGTYDPKFAAAWNAVGAMQRERVATSGWWKRGAPGQPPSGGGAGLGVMVAFIAIFIAVGAGAFSSVVDVLRVWPLALVVAIVGPALAALAAYRSLLPARSAQGSALALQAESFRRFLHASEGKHVEWAWTHGLLREYSGWAVALGEADAWNRALAAADVPPPARASMGPIIVAGHRSSITASHTKPSSSSSSGSGGFSGGSVGGGGGGGSRGSW